MHNVDFIYLFIYRALPWNRYTEDTQAEEPLQQEPITVVLLHLK